MTTQSDTLMLDIVSRLARIETKMDAGTAAALILTADVTSVAARVDILEKEQVALKTTVRTVSWIGGAVLTLVTLFSSAIARLFT